MTERRERPSARGRADRNEGGSFAKRPGSDASRSRGGQARFGRPGDAGERRQRSASRPGERTGADRPKRTFERAEQGADRPKRTFERAEQGADRPKRTFERAEQGTDRPKRTFERAEQGADRPKRTFERAEQGADRPKRTFERAEQGADRPKRTFERAGQGADRRKRTFGKPGRTEGRGSTGFTRPDSRSVDANRQMEDEMANDFIVGRRPVLEALKSGRPVNKLLVAEGTEGGSLTEILGKARGEGIVVQTVPRLHISKIAGGEVHQGILAYVSPQPYVELEDIIARETEQAPLMVLLDEITDPYNFGAILRTAEATGVQGVVIPKRRSVPLTGVVAKAAAGAVEHVPVARVSNLVQAIEELKENGYWIVGAEVNRRPLIRKWIIRVKLPL